jgi:hypothetical protein
MAGYGRILRSLNRSADTKGQIVDCNAPADDEEGRKTENDATYSDNLANADIEQEH